MPVFGAQGADLGEVAYDFDDEERIATGVALQCHRGAVEVVSRRRLRHGYQQVCHRRLRETRKRYSGDAGLASQIRQELRGRCLTLHVRRPIRGNDHQRHARGAVDDIAKEGHRAGVGPMQVVDDEQDRLTTGSGLKEPGHGCGQAGAVRFGGRRCRGPQSRHPVSQQRHDRAEVAGVIGGVLGQHTART